MKRLLFVILLVLCVHVIGAEAANWYVRPSGGSGAGTSWTAAWNEMDGINWSSVSCGDTIWVAGGTYANRLTPNKSCTSGSQLYIRRARSDDSACTGAAGWTSGYDATVLQDSATDNDLGRIWLTNTLNYVTISGRTASSGGGYGWKINNHNASGDAIGIYSGNGTTVNYLTVEYMELQGPYRADVVGPSWGIRGISNNPYGGGSVHQTFSHLKIHGWGTAIFAMSVDYYVFEYMDMYDISSLTTSGLHPNLMYIRYANNGIIRYSKFYNSQAYGTGVAFSDGGPFDGWEVYGNLFYDLTGASNTAMAVQGLGGTFAGLKIYNNTFSNCTVDFRLSSATCSSGCETKNNIYNGGTNDSNGTMSNNLTTSNSSIFVNSAAKDFHIVSSTSAGYPRNAGTSLSSYFRTDMGGTLFGADGTWDIGAYEYNGGGTVSVAPSAPFNLR